MTNRTIATILLLLLGAAGIWIGAEGKGVFGECVNRYGNAPTECATWHEPMSMVLLVLAGIGLVAVVLLTIRSDPRKEDAHGRPRI